MSENALTRIFLFIGFERTLRTEPRGVDHRGCPLLGRDLVLPLPLLDVLLNRLFVEFLDRRSLRLLDLRPVPQE